MLGARLLSGWRTALLVVVLGGFLDVSVPAGGAAAPWLEGVRADFQGFDCYTFEFDGATSHMVVPREPAEGKPWVWRSLFFGHEPQTDKALLERGFHVAYCDVLGLYGSPKAVERWNRFYKLLTETHGFSKKPILEGFSRGGLIALVWAIANPQSVGALYLDAPVCDVRSWPAGKGKGKGSPAEWQQCLKVYGLTEDQVDGAPIHPIDRLEPLAAERVPILSVCGDADQVVPLEENTRVLEKRYRELCGPIEVIVKPGVDHHPHSLKDPTPIVEFLLHQMIR
ncbi:MAG: alpha/beta hydrolase family protein [Thermoguttaceae bacterium]